ncbi:hypothetical protein PHLGIDRAFT_131155, partial [Phlebiopsis gigantea 11061_1 CR5-6]
MTMGSIRRISTSTAASQLEDRIRVLSRLLDHHALTIPISNIDPSNLEVNEELRFFYYLATLLTTGTYEQNCAVTAIVLPGVVKCVIAHTGERRNGPGEAAQMKVHRVQERRIDIETLGSAPSKSDSVDFETHAADLLHALNTFHSALRDCTATTSAYWHFLRFIVRRCHTKIAERMHNGERIWKRHPIALLEGWEPPHRTLFATQEFAFHHQVLESTLSVYGITKTRDEGDRQIYTFEKHNARGWAKTACAVYGVLHKRLFTPSLEGNKLIEMPRASMDLESVEVVADYLDALAVLLDLPPMKAILFHPSFTSLLEPIEREAPRPHPALQRRKTVSSTTTDDADVDEAIRQEEESEGEHVFRYLRAVVSWVAATLTVAQHEVFRAGIPLEVFHIHLPKETRHDIPLFHALRDEVLGELVAHSDEHKRARTYFASQENALRLDAAHSVHAEAALLHLLTDDAAQHSSPELRALFSYRGAPLAGGPGALFA